VVAERVSHAAYCGGIKQRQVARNPVSTFPPLAVQTTPNAGFSIQVHTPAAVSSYGPMAAASLWPKQQT